MLNEAGQDPQLHRDIGLRRAVNLVQKHDVPTALVVVIVVASPVAECEAAALPGAAELLGIMQHHAVGGEQDAAPLPCFVQCSCPASRDTKLLVVKGRQEQ